MNCIAKLQVSCVGEGKPVASIPGGHDTINVALLWGYVILRVVHSIIQNTTNIVAFRFYAFVASSLCLVVIVVRELIRVFFG